MWPVRPLLECPTVLTDAPMALQHKPRSHPRMCYKSLYFLKPPLPSAGGFAAASAGGRGLRPLTDGESRFLSTTRRVHRLRSAPIH